VFYCSTEATMLSPDEVARLERLPDAANTVPEELECDLEDGHDGAHVALGQSQEHSAEEQTLWWLRWTNEGERVWTHEPMCPAERGDDVCLLATGHVSGHHWG
jgi:hypothetical protein